MVFGFFEKGKVDLELNKFNFSIEEVIEGTAKLQLKKPVKAKGFFVVIFAELITQKANVRGVGMSTSTNVKRAFEFKQQLDGEKEYDLQPFEYKFKINVPNQNNQAKMDGPMASVASAIKMFTVGNQHVKWYVEAKLDIPGGFDVGKKVQINIG